MKENEAHLYELESAYGMRFRHHPIYDQLFIYCLIVQHALEPQSDGQLSWISMYALSIENLRKMHIERLVSHGDCHKLLQ